MTRSMRILCINIASQKSFVACVTPEQTCAITVVDHRIGDGELLPVVEFTLKNADWKETDITHIACVTGPGGFTSLRVGVAMANTLAHALKIPSAGVHMSDLYRARTSTADLLWVHSAKAQELFIRGFGAHAKRWPEATVHTTDALMGELPNNVVWMGEIIETHGALLEAKHAKPAPLESLEKTLPDFLAHLPYKTELLHPWYGREG